MEMRGIIGVGMGEFAESREGLQVDKAQHCRVPRGEI